MLLPKPRKTKLGQEEYLAQRKQVFDNFDWRCANCNKILPLQRDHIKKRSQGGGDEIENAQPLCPKCHNEKDNVAKSKSAYTGQRRGSDELTMKPFRASIEGTPNVRTSEADSEQIAQKPLNEGGGGQVSTASQGSAPLLSSNQNKQSFTIDDLPYWFDATGAQGNPNHYRHGDLEMWVKGIMDRYPFLGRAASRRHKIMAFEDVWDASEGDSYAIAYAFNAALEQKIYSIQYVKGCLKGAYAPRNQVSTPKPMQSRPSSSKPTLPKKSALKVETIDLKVKASPAPKEKRSPKIKVVEPEEVKIDWS
jgi:hypothetical protein